MMKNQDVSASSVSVAGKERLAKLLATENLTVIHSASVSTASFDTENRVLTLPVYENMTSDMYDLLIGHEGGHAHWTPNDGGWREAIADRRGLMTYFNVVEDARIEKKMQRKYPGLRKSFKRGYAEMAKRDFFGVQGRNLATLKLIDRINLYFKAGLDTFAVPFTDEERPWLKRIEEVESFDKVMKIATELYELAKETETDEGEGGEPGEPQPGDEDGDGQGESFGPDNDDSSDTDGESNTDTDGDGDENASGSDDDAADGDEDGDSTNSSSPGDESDDDSDSDSADSGSSGAGRGEGSNDPISETDEALKRNLEDAVDLNAAEWIYTTIPKLNDTIEFHHKELWDRYFKDLGDARSSGHSLASDEVLLAKVNEFRKNNKAVVNYLAKEFDLKKAADASARSATAATGVLDTNTLHRYKWSDDIFKKITTIPDGKNHGLVMYIDWSGSMGGSMASTIDQLMVLVLFCKRVGIPFEVYAFSDSTQRAYREEVELSDNYRHGDYVLNSNVRMMNLFSSTMRASEFNRAMKGMVSVQTFFASQYSGNGYIPRWMSLGGTPLNEAIIHAINVVPKFRAKNHLQIVNTVFLTDGEGSWLTDVKGTDRNLNSRRQTNVILRDSRTRKEYSIIAGDYEYNPQTRVFFNALRDIGGVEVIGFYLTNPRGARDAVHGCAPDAIFSKFDELVKKFSKDSFLAFSEVKGYSDLYIINSGKLDLIEDSTLDDSLKGQSVTKIRTAFKKNAGSKIKNRVLLKRFVEKIVA